LFITCKDEIIGIGENKNDQLNFTDSIQGMVKDAACTANISIVILRTGHAMTFGKNKITECFLNKEIQGKVKKISAGFSHVIYLLNDLSVKI